MENVKSENADLSSVEFLRLAPDPDRSEPLAQLQGRLVLKNGEREGVRCLGVKGRSGDPVSLVWAPSAELTTRDGKVAVRDRQTDRVYVVGQEITLGGGETNSLSNIELSAGASENCAPPYIITHFSER